MSISPNPIATGWLNENSLREYPFHEGVGLRPSDSAGSMVEFGWSLPNCLVVDMSVSVDGSHYDPFLYLGRMSVVDRSVTLVFCDRDGNAVMSVYATEEGHEKYDSYQMAGTGSFSDSRGVICLGDLAEFFSRTPDGAYAFSPEESMLEPTCIRPSVSGVRALRAVDTAGYTSARLTGDVKLVAGRNIRLDYDPSDNSIKVSADPNSGYYEKCDCLSGSSVGRVRSINGVSVSNVQIVGDDCIHVSVSDGIVHITDECAKPCCGCAETAFINKTINDLQSAMSTISGNVSSLGDRLMMFMQSYVLSRKTLQ